MNSAQAVENCVALCLQVSLVVLATIFLQHWVREAKTGCRLWTVCFLSILGLAAVSVLLPHRRLFVFPDSLSNTTLLNIVTIEAKLVVIGSVVYLTGVGVSLLRRGIRCATLLRFIKSHCQPLTDQQVAMLPLHSQVDDSPPAAGVPLPKHLRWMVSDRIQGPFCWQLHRPVIVLPRYVIDGDEKTLRHILLHELEHLRTKHPMQHFIQGACSTLFWFHPAMWMAANGAELTREYLCDEVAASSEGKFASYLRTLVKIAEHCGNTPCSEVSASTLAFGNSKSALIKRSERLVQLAQRTPAARPIRPVHPVRSLAAVSCLIAAVLLASQLWLPVNAMASSRSNWSPWPKWTASVLHDFDVSVRDFELFDERVQIHELYEHSDD